MIPVKVGDFVIARTRYRSKVYCVSKVTEKKFWYKSDFFKLHGRNEPREMRGERDSIIFAGTETVTKKLHAQLESSEALMNEDHEKASARREKRDADFIERANFAMAE